MSDVIGSDHGSDHLCSQAISCSVTAGSKTLLATFKPGSSFESGNPYPREGTRFTAFLSNVKVVQSETLLPRLVARTMLNRSISRESKILCGAKRLSSIYEKVSVRFNRSCG